MGRYQPKGIKFQLSKKKKPGDLLYNVATVNNNVLYTWKRVGRAELLNVLTQRKSNKKTDGEVNYIMGKCSTFVVIREM